MHASPRTDVFAHLTKDRRLPLSCHELANPFTLAAMDSMKELKDWLVTKCRLPGFQQTLRPSDGPETKYNSNVVTPKSIPEFVIPGSADSSRNPSICSSDDLRSHSSGMSVTCSPCTSPAVSPRNSLAGLAVPENKSPVRVRSAPVSPRRDSHGFLRDFGARSLSNLQPNPSRGEATGEQAQPPSAAAETSYFKTKNNLGYSLKESPHNRRKELYNQHNKSEPDHKYHRGFMRRPFRSHESLISHDAAGAACALPEHSCLSATSSPRRCSPVFADQNDYLPLRESFRRSQRYYRRRSSLAQVEMTTALWRQNSDLGESPSRRIPVTSLMAPLHHGHAYKRHSAPSAAPADCIIVSISNHCSEEQEAGSSGVTSSSREGVGAERPQAEQNGESKLVTERGDIKFSFQYFPATRRLKLLLIRAENLHFPERPDVVTNPFFKVSA